MPRTRSTSAPSATAATRRSPGGQRAEVTRAVIPGDVDDITVDVGGRAVKLTNLRKPFWTREGITKGDLLRYYADVAPLLLPHVRDRAMVMKRYPHGAEASRSS